MREYTQEELRKIQALGMETLREFIRICEKYGLDYFAISGTAIGAVRHKGFIPWDDDMDVGMLREDYDRFLEVAPGELKGRYELYSASLQKQVQGFYLQMFPAGSVFMTRRNARWPLHPGIKLDIFPYDRVPADGKRRARLYRRLRFWNRLYIIKNTKVIKYGGKIFEQNLAVAKYWIFNYRVEDHIYPKKNQIYVQCWHGTPLKRLGYDLKNSHNAMNSDEEIYSRYKIDAKKFRYILSPSHFASEKFITAWNLANTNMTNKVVEEGYPRNDFLYNYTLDDIKQIKQNIGIPEDKKVILYAPTYRDNQHQSGIGYTYQTEVNFDFLQKELQKDYIILFRAHYLVANSFNFEKYKGFVYNVSEYDDINYLYIISDLLITDYSSVFFDYANLKRPIIFYMYDLEQYKEELRGFYLDISELPGKIAQTDEELISLIESTKNFVYDEKYQLFNKKYNYLDDGQATKRVTDKIFK